MKILQLTCLIIDPEMQPFLGPNGATVCGEPQTFHINIIKDHPHSFLYKLLLCKLISSCYKLPLSGKQRKNNWNNFIKLICQFDIYEVYIFLQKII